MLYDCKRCDINLLLITHAKYAYGKFPPFAAYFSTAPMTQLIFRLLVTIFIIEYKRWVIRAACVVQLIICIQYVGLWEALKISLRLCQN